MARADALNRCLIDTGIVYALADGDDSWHARAVSFVASYRGRIVVPSSVVPEACYLLNKHLGQHAELAFIRSLLNREIQLEQSLHADLMRIEELLNQYHDANIGFVDASCIAMAERLAISAILTTDRRHYSLIRPRHCQAFDLLP